MFSMYSIAVPSAPVLTTRSTALRAGIPRLPQLAYIASCGFRSPEQCPSCRDNLPIRRLGGLSVLLSRSNYSGPSRSRYLIFSAQCADAQMERDQVDTWKNVPGRRISNYIYADQRQQSTPRPAVSFRALRGNSAAICHYAQIYSCCLRIPKISILTERQSARFPV